MTHLQPGEWKRLTNTGEEFLSSILGLKEFLSSVLELKVSNCGNPAGFGKQAENPLALYSQLLPQNLKRTRLETSGEVPFCDKK